MNVGGVPVREFLPPSGRGPAVVVVQEIFGLSPYVLERCVDLAEDGYLVLAPDLYAALDDYPSFEEAADDYVMQGVAASQRLPWATAVAIVSDTLDAARAHPAGTGRAALLGFCYGGGVAFEVASRNAPDALVSYYGSAVPSLLELAPKVTVPSLHHYGLADAWIPLEAIEATRDAVTAAGPQVEFELYEGANHAFDNPFPAFHHPAASALAWQRTLAFLEQHLR